MLSYSAVFIKELSWKFVNLCEISKLFRTAILKNIWRQLLLYCLYHIIISLTKVISYIQSRRFKQEGDTTETLGVFTWHPKWNLPERKFQSTIKEILFTLLFIVGKMKQVSFRGSPEIYGPLSKSQSFLFTHVCLQKPFTYFYFVQ